MSPTKKSKGGGFGLTELLLIGILIMVIVNPTAVLGFLTNAGAMVGGIANQVGSVTRNSEFSLIKTQAEANPNIDVRPNIIVQQDPAVGQALQKLTEQNMQLQQQVQGLQSAMATPMPKATPFIPMILNTSPEPTSAPHRNLLEKLRDANPFIPHGWFGKP